MIVITNNLKNEFNIPPKYVFIILIFDNNDNIIIIL